LRSPDHLSSLGVPDHQIVPGFLQWLRLIGTTARRVVPSQNVGSVKKRVLKKMGKKKYVFCSIEENITYPRGLTYAFTMAWSTDQLLITKTELVNRNESFFFEKRKKKNKAENKNLSPKEN
jgi:hypothetical protein